MAQAGLEVGQVALTATDFPSSTSKVLRCVTQRVPRHTALYYWRAKKEGENTHVFACVPLKLPQLAAPRLWEDEEQSEKSCRLARFHSAHQ